MDWVQYAVWAALPIWAKIAVVAGGAILGGGGLRALILAFAPRYLDHRTRHTNITRSLCHQIQCLEKQMIVAFYYPQVDLGGYDALVSQLQDTVLNNHDMSTLKGHEHAAVTDVLHECDNARRYLSIQARRRSAYTTQYKEEIVSCARRTLICIYKARDCFGDKKQIRWPYSPKGPGGKAYWRSNQIIERPEEVRH